MKLIRKTNRYFLRSLLIIMVLSCVLIYFGISYLLQREAKEKLQNDETRLVQSLKNGTELNSLEPFFVITPTNEEDHESRIVNSTAYDPVEKEEEEYLELTSVRNINSQHYQLIVRQPAVETDELVLVILISFFAIMLLSLSALYFLNKSFSFRIWSPFYKTLNQVESFSVEKGTPISPSETDIDEFIELDAALEKLSDKLISDYLALKEFTENASHEIQTPLSIILLNLEEAMQANLDTNTAEKIYASYQAAGRLSRLNEKLLLLTKLDNKQFQGSEQSDLNDILNKQLSEFISLMEARGLSVERSIKGKFDVQLDHGLATILISNLLSNALKHCDQGGSISVISNEMELKISNSSNESPDVSRLFERFQKHRAESASLGLGLSISKKITEQANLHIELEAKEGVFAVSISRKKDFIRKP